jgi:hypothetical protein
LYGTWEISSVSGEHTGPAHEGNSRTMGMHADEKSDGCIVPVKPRTMPSDIGGGDGGGTAAGQGEGELQRMLRTQRRNGMSLKQRAHGSELHGYPIPRMPIAFDLRQEPGAGKPHAGICAGCVLQVRSTQPPEMAVAVKPSEQPRTESCVVGR